MAFEILEARKSGFARGDHFRQFIALAGMRAAYEARWSVRCSAFAARHL
jgi:hypothetical protein